MYENLFLHSHFSIFGEIPTVFGKFSILIPFKITTAYE